MKQKPRKLRRNLAKLTPHEDHCWVFSFSYYLDAGHTEVRADKLAWRDMCLEFPRLLKFDGCAA